MRIRLTLKFKVNRKPEILETMLLFRDACNYVSKYAIGNGAFRRFALHKALYYRMRSEFPLPAQYVCSTFRSVASAYRKSRKKQRIFKSLFLPLTRKDYRVKDDVISVSTAAGRVTLGMKVSNYHRQRLASGDWTQKEATLSFDRKGRLYINITYEREVESAQPEQFVGIDLGIKKALVASNSHIATGRKERERGNRYFRLVRALQAKGTKSARRHLRALSGRWTRFQACNAHTLAKRFVQSLERPTLIVMERLTHIRERAKSFGKRNRRRLHGWNFARLQTLIEHKALLAGHSIVYVDPAYSSQTCSRCGHVEHSNRRNSLFRCKRCGFQLDADLNASRNLAQRGKSLLSGLSVNQPIVVGGSHKRAS